MANDNLNTVYEDATWSIILRPRNNSHAGEPNMKVWVLRKGQEVAQYTNKFRGYDHYRDHEELLDPSIAEAAKKTWDMLKEGEYTPEMLEAIRTEVAGILQK